MAFLEIQSLKNVYQILSKMSFFGSDGWWRYSVHAHNLGFISQGAHVPLQTVCVSKITQIDRNKDISQKSNILGYFTNSLKI